MNAFEVGIVLLICAVFVFAILLNDHLFYRRIERMAQEIRKNSDSADNAVLVLGRRHIKIRKWAEQQMPEVFPADSRLAGTQSAVHVINQVKTYVLAMLDGKDELCDCGRAVFMEPAEDCPMPHFHDAVSA